MSNPETSLRTIVTCECGATYERTKTKLTFRGKDSFSCWECGNELEFWDGSRLPQFRQLTHSDGSKLDGKGAPAATA